jgi:hypothetical protein
VLHFHREECSDNDSDMALYPAPGETGWKSEGSSQKENDRGDRKGRKRRIKYCREREPYGNRKMSVANTKCEHSGRGGRDGQLFRATRRVERHTQRACRVVNVLLECVASALDDIDWEG